MTSTKIAPPVLGLCEAFLRLGTYTDPMLPDECRICGVNLAEQDHPLARLVAWPPALLPGDLPAEDELCRQCRTKVKAAFQNPAPYVTAAEGEGPTIYPQWQATGPGSWKL
jgi:hypothetical protein